MDKQKAAQDYVNSLQWGSDDKADAGLIQLQVKSLAQNSFIAGALWQAASQGKGVGDEDITKWAKETNRSPGQATAVREFIDWLPAPDTVQWQEDYDPPDTVQWQEDYDPSKYVQKELWEEVFSCSGYVLYDGIREKLQSTYIIKKR